MDIGPIQGFFFLKSAELSCRGRLAGEPSVCQKAKNDPEPLNESFFSYT